MGKFPSEVEEALTEADLLEWCAYFKVVAEMEKAAQEEAERKAKAR